MRHEGRGFTEPACFVGSCVRTTDDATVYTYATGSPSWKRGNYALPTFGGPKEVKGTSLSWETWIAQVLANILSPTKWTSGGTSRDREISFTVINIILTKNKTVRS